MAGKPRENSSRAIREKLSESLGFEVSAKMLRWWVKKGYPLDDIDELKRRVANQQGGAKIPKDAKPSRVVRNPKPKPGKPVKPSRPAPDQPMRPIDPTKVENELADLQIRLLSCDNYDDARTINTKIVGIRGILKELREQGKYMLREVATAAGMEAGLASLAAWERIEDDLPPMLEGLTAAQMKVKLRDYGRAQSLELAKHFAA